MVDSIVSKKIEHDFMKLSVLERIRAIMSMKEIDAEELARGLNISRQSVSRMLNHRTHLKVSRIKKIGEILQIDPSIFV